MSEELRNEEVREVLKLGQLPGSVVNRYLNIYLGFMDWMPELNKLVKKYKDPVKVRQIICAAILLPMIDRSTKIDQDHPENLLHKISYFQQFEDRDWMAEFQKVFERDTAIDMWRKDAYVLGVVKPFEYSPITRQAYNWLYTKADESGIIKTPELKQDISTRFENLVAAYGGAVICNIFSRHEEHLKDVINWRTGYFFERIIYDVYSIEQICKIKKSELDTTNPKLVKPVRII